MKYERLDAMILARIGRQEIVKLTASSIDAGEIHALAKTFSSGVSYRVVERRLQVMRKAGLIRFSAQSGWAVVNQESGGEK